MFLAVLSSRAFGRVVPIAHTGCGEGRRDLVFEVEDPQGRVVRLTHGHWRDKLRIGNRVQLQMLLPEISAAIQRPRLIQADSVDDKTLLYYGKSSATRGKLLCVPVKCLPRRFQDGRSQRRLGAIGLVSDNGWGEAWVASAYLVVEPKRRGRPIWPS